MTGAARIVTLAGDMAESTERYGTETWSLELPEGWSFEHDGEVATLLTPGGSGALQIGVALKDSEVLPGDLESFASEQTEAGAEPAPCTAGEFEGLELSFEDGGSAFRQWYLRNDRQLLFVTYACPLAERGAQDEALGTLLDSLMAEGS